VTALAPAAVPLMDDEEQPLSQEQMLKALAAWLPGATKQHQAAEAAKKAYDAAHPCHA